MTSSISDRSALPLSQATDGELTQFKSCLTRAGFNVGLILGVNTAKDNAVASAMRTAAARCLGEPVGEKAVEFTSPRMQLAMLRSWRRRFRKELSFITDEAVAELERSVPACPPGRLAAVTLVVSLGDVVRTVRFLWARAAEAQPDSWVWESLRFDKEHMRLADGQPCPKGVRWEVVDLGVNTDRRPDDVLAEADRPRPYTVLASSAMHPLWVQAMDGHTVPFAIEASVECTLAGRVPWRGVLLVCFVRGARQAGLGAHWRGYANPYSAVPAPSSV